MKRVLLCVALFGLAGCVVGCEARDASETMPGERVVEILRDDWQKIAVEEAKVGDHDHCDDTSPELQELCCGSLLRDVQRHAAESDASDDPWTIVVEGMRAIDALRRYCGDCEGTELHATTCG